jgi:hypothetical protein
MTRALEELSWDLEAADGGPRRPSLEDMGGATLVDDTEFEPDRSRMPYAAQLNQLQKQASAQGQVVESLVLSVEFSGGAPAVVAFTCPRTGMGIDDFTVTDNGTGDTTITWPADTFPPELTRPELTINQDIGAIVGGTVVAVTNGVRVRTYQAAGAVDLHFTATRR